MLIYLDSSTSSPTEVWIESLFKPPRTRRFRKGQKVTFEVLSRVFAFTTNADRPRRFGQTAVGSDTACYEPKNDSTVFNILNLRVGTTQGGGRTALKARLIIAMGATHGIEGP
jgi:hypothetical protein